MDHSFALEHLEGRALFSVAAPAALTPLTAAAVLPAVHHVTAVPPMTPLLGAFNISGTYTQPFGHNPDGGGQYHFVGSGRKRSLGQFTMSGDLQGPGFIATGRFRGYFTLTNALGSIVVRITGPEQTPGPLPATMLFKISGGTGAYVNSYGKGQLAVSASATTHKFVFQFNPVT